MRKSKKTTPGADAPTVLLVENDKAAFDATAAMLRAAGLNVVHATTAVDALDVLRSARRIDLLFACVQMPGQPSGFTLARMARLRRRDLPVIYAAESGVDSKETDRALGPILQRPFDADTLASEINAVLGTSR